MAEIDTFLLLIAPDPHREGGFVAYAPDIPGWTAHGRTRPEAAERGSEIVRALAASRAADGENAAEPSVYGIGVPVPKRPAPAPEAPPPSEPAGIRTVSGIAPGPRPLPFGGEHAWGPIGDGADEDADDPGDGPDGFHDAFDDEARRRGA